MSTKSGVIWVGNPDWRAMLPHYVRGLLAAVVITAVAYGLQVAGVLAPALVVLIGLTAFVGAFAVCHFIRRMTVYTLTSSRVLKKSGIINVRKEQARVEMITNIIIDRSLIQRMIGIGDLDIDTANDNNSTLVWWGIKDPYRIEALIDDVRSGNSPDPEVSDDEEDDDFKYS